MPPSAATLALASSPSRPPAADLPVAGAPTPGLVVGLQSAARARLQRLFDEGLLVEVGTPQAALQLLTAQRASLLLLDARTPGLLAADLDALRQAAPGTPKALLGDESESESVARLLEGVDFDFLSLGAEALEGEIRRMLRPRTAERLQLRQGGFLVEGQLEGRRFSYPLVDWSAGGLAFVAPLDAPMDGFLTGALVRELRVVGSEGAVRFRLAAAVVRRAALEPASEGREAGVRVGLSFESTGELPAAPARLISELPAVLASVRKAIRSKSAFLLRVPGAEATYAFDEVQLEQGSRPALILQGPHQGRTVPDLAPFDVVRLSFEHHGQSYMGEAAVREVEGGLRVSLPRVLQVRHRRSSNRRRPPPGRTYRVRLKSRLAGVDRTFGVWDLNATGVSVVVDGAREPLAAGLVLDELEFVLPEGGEPLRCGGIVRGLVPLAGRGGEGQQARCGIEFVDLDERGRARLGQALVADGFPFLEPAGPEAFGEIWQFLADANFKFHFYAAEDERTQRTVRHAFDKLLGPGRPVAVNLLYRREGQLHGHIAGLQVYSRTWLATHLAARQGTLPAVVERASRALSLGVLEHLESRPGVEFVKFIWSRSQPWSNRMMGWAARTVHRAGLSELREVSHLVCPLDEVRAPQVRVPVEIRPADAGERQLVARYFAERASVVRIRSEDLGVSELLLGSLEKSYAACGLERRRHLHVALVGGQLAGFSLLEQSTSALQLSEITNAFELFALPGLAPDEEAAVRSRLLSDAVAFYRAQGLAHAVAITDAADLTPYQDAGFRIASQSRAWTMHRSIVRAWCDVWDVLYEHSEGHAKGERPRQ